MAELQTFKDTTATRRIFQLNKRIRAVSGGTAASKTISILVWLIDYAQTNNGKIISVVSESFPHLSGGAMLDFEKIMKAHGYWKDSRWIRSPKPTYTFETGSKIEFISVDTYGKAHGPRRDVLFINEANNLAYNIADQLITRTREIVWMDWNPSTEFWFYSEFQHRDDVDFITLTYKDNEALDETTIREIEAHKNNKNWWRVYGLGQLGVVEGRIYSGWQTIDEIPHGARLERYGVDFGYSNDPTAIIALYYYDGGYLVDEITFQKGLSNKQIADILLNQDKALVVCDSAEPKSIDELISYGVNAIGVKKKKIGEGPEKQFKRWSINVVQQQQISVTKRSLNILKEYRNYMWMIDKDGKILNEPEHVWSHCFAPETFVHTTKGKKRIDELVGTTGYLYSKDGTIQRFYDVKPTRKNADVVTLHLSDNESITVTPDHLLLRPDGIWQEAGLFSPQDMIQSVMYGRKKNIPREVFSSRLSNVLWTLFLPLSWEQILQRVCQWQSIFSPSFCMGTGEGANTQGLSYSSQGRGSGKQSHLQFRAETQNRAFKRTYDTRTEEGAKEVDRKNKTFSKQMARVKRGKRVSLVAWEEKLGRTPTLCERVCSLPYRVRNAYQSFKRQVLWKQLQDESTAKKIERVTRGRRAVTYNLEVENTHCLLANGVLAHNSMDALRYAMVSVAPIIQQREMVRNMPVLARSRQQPENPAR